MIETIVTSMLFAPAVMLWVVFHYELIADHC